MWPPQIYAEGWRMCVSGRGEITKFLNNKKRATLIQQTREKKTHAIGETNGRIKASHLERNTPLMQGLHNSSSKLYSGDGESETARQPRRLRLHRKTVTRRGSPSKSNHGRNQIDTPHSNHPAISPTNCDGPEQHRPTNT